MSRWVQLDRSVDKIDGLLTGQIYSLERWIDGSKILLFQTSVRGNLTTPYTTNRTYGLQDG